MKAIILAAGVGSRLMPLTKRMPKCLLSVNGKTLLERTLAYLGNSVASLPHDVSVEEVVIVTGHGEACLRDFASQKKYPFRMKFIFNPFYPCANNLVSLFLAFMKEEFPDGFILLNSDLYFHPQIILRVLASPLTDLLIVDNTSDLREEAMKVKIEDGKIVDISKTIDPRKADGEYIGIARFSKKGGEELKRRMAEMLESNGKDAFYEAAIREMLPYFSVHPLFTEGLPWVEIDTFKDLEKAKRLSRFGVR